MTSRRIERFLRRPERLLGTLSQVGMELNSLYYKYRGIDFDSPFVESDWDNLLILDGCRYDLFDEVCECDGQLFRRVSGASESSEFIERQFLNRELHDIVYITANPYSYIIPDGVFHAVISLLETAWDEDLGTVRPDEAAEVAREVSNKFPNKRYIVHFMQPHFPFIGETGLKFSQGKITSTDQETDDQTPQIWKQLQYRESGVDPDTVWNAYRENLELVLPVAIELAEYLGGKSVLTSDHGNLIGDRMWPVPLRGYGHPRGLYLSKLVEVPWFETMHGPRRETFSEDPEVGDRTIEDNINDRLNALGYR